VLTHLVGVTDGEGAGDVEMRLEEVAGAPYSDEKEPPVDRDADGRLDRLLKDDDDVIAADPKLSKLQQRFYLTMDVVVELRHLCRHPLKKRGDQIGQILDVKVKNFAYFDVSLLAIESPCFSDRLSFIAELG
jgi:hypothetical protein